MQLAAISFERHGQQGLRTNDTYYRFAEQDSLIPVVAAELPSLLPNLPLAFLPAGAGYVLVALTSLLPGKNLCVAPTTGQWLGDYVPAALRAWPFRMLSPEAAANPVLCIDEDCGLLVPQAQGTDFFDSTGKPQAFVQQMADFLAHIEASRAATQVAVDALQAAAVIHPWPLQTEKDGEVRPVDGLFRVDEAALNALDAAALKILGDKGALAIAYAQLFSMHQLAALDKLKPMHARLQEQASRSSLDYLRTNDTISFGNLG